MVRYLLNSAFITSRQAERCVAKTCLNYLHFSLSLIDKDVSEETQTINVGKFFYSLQPYIHEHWVDHLLTYGSGLQGAQDDQLEKCWNRLIRLFEPYENLKRLRTSSIAFEDAEEAVGIEPRLEAFRYQQHMFQLLSSIIKQRHLTKLNFNSSASSRK
jgi:hypothetical protein